MMEVSRYTLGFMVPCASYHARPFNVNALFMTPGIPFARYFAVPTTGVSGWRAERGEAKPVRLDANVSLAGGEKTTVGQPGQRPPRP